MDHTRSEFLRESDIASDADDDITPDGNGNDKDQEQIDKERYARESHCEIERRRRNKMTAYISELCDMVPTCSSLARKPDKLTILRMAVTHMKTLRGTGNTGVDGSYKPSFLSDQELKHLILEAADGFLFVCQCEDGRVIYVSDSVSSVLNQNQSDWYQHTLYDLCHPEDTDKIREQLCPNSLSNNISNSIVSNNHNNHIPNNSNNTSQSQSSASSSTVVPPSSNVINHHTNNGLINNNLDNNPVNITTARILDLKTGTVKKEGHQSQIRACVGSRRGFICRMRLGHSANINGGSENCNITSRTMRIRQRNTVNQTSNGLQYALVHVTGYVKTWMPQNAQSQDNSNLDPNVMGNNNGNGNTNNNNNSNICNGGSLPVSNQCLVALGRLQVTSVVNTSDLSPHRQHEFVSRHSDDLKTSFCDQRVNQVLGFQSHELLDKSLLDFVHPDDQISCQDAFEQAWKLKGQVITVMLRMRNCNNDYVTIGSSMFAFVNPYSEEVEYVVITNTSTKGLPTPRSNNHSSNNNTNPSNNVGLYPNTDASIGPIVNNNNNNSSCVYPISPNSSSYQQLNAQHLFTHQFPNPINNNTFYNGSNMLSTTANNSNNNNSSNNSVTNNLSTTGSNHSEHSLSKTPLTINITSSNNVSTNSANSTALPDHLHHQHHQSNNILNTSRPSAICYLPANVTTESHLYEPNSYLPAPAYYDSRTVITESNNSNLSTWYNSNNSNNNSNTNNKLPPYLAQSHNHNNLNAHHYQPSVAPSHSSIDNTSSSSSVNALDLFPHHPQNVTHSTLPFHQPLLLNTTTNNINHNNLTQTPPTTCNSSATSSSSSITTAPNSISHNGTDHNLDFNPLILNPNEFISQNLYQTHHLSHHHHLPPHQLQLDHLNNPYNTNTNINDNTNGNTNHAASLMYNSLYRYDEIDASNSQLSTSITNNLSGNRV